MTNRRDFIKWVIYLGSVAQLPALSVVPDQAFNILEGISHVPVKLAELSTNPVAFRVAEDDAFEEVMHRMWKEKHGSAPYLKIVQDMGTHPAHWVTDAETGERYEVPESYLTLFQYRKA